MHMPHWVRRLDVIMLRRIHAAAILMKIDRQRGANIRASAMAVVLGRGRLAGSRYFSRT
jgi:hypothetical protein